MPKRPGRKSAAQTPAPRSERIYGSKKNKPGSASGKGGGKITLSPEITEALKKKAAEFNKAHPNNKVRVSTLKMVFRRGSGAYSKSHRPTIGGNVPNTRSAWSFARVNKFLKKKAGQKVKAAYVQDDDLLAKGGKIQYDDKALLSKYNRGESIGFTAEAHLKAKGLIPRADGTKRKSEKYLADGDGSNPDIRYAKGGKIIDFSKTDVVIKLIGYGDEKEFKDYWSDNIIPKNPFFAWLYNDVSANEKVNNGQYELAKPKTALGKFWNTDVKDYKGGENIISLLAGRISDDGKKIYILSMTTNPTYRKSGGMSYLIKKVREHFNIEIDNVYFVGLTDMGEKFARKKKYHLGGNTFDGNNPDIRYENGSLIDADPEMKKGGKIGDVIVKEQRGSVIFQIKDDKKLVGEAKLTKHKNIEAAAEFYPATEDYLQKAKYLKEHRFSACEEGWELEYIEVFPAYQSRGYGKKLLNEVKKWARQNSVNVIFVYAQPYGEVSVEHDYKGGLEYKALMSFYEKNGFERISKQELALDLQKRNLRKFDDGGVVFVRNKNYDNSKTIRRLPYRGVSAFAVHTDDFEKFKQFAEKEEGIDPSNWQVYDMDDFDNYEVCAMRMSDTNDYVMGWSDEKPELKLFDPEDHAMYIDEDGQLDYDDAYEVIILPKKMAKGGTTALFIHNIVSSAKDIDEIVEYALENDINPKEMTLEEFNKKVNPDGKYSTFEVRLAKRELTKYYKTGGDVNQKTMEIICNKCGWKWNTADSKPEDATTCHKCGYDNVSEDIIAMNAPAYLRSLEFAREDAKDDVDLHKVTENAVALSKEHPIRMDDYDELVQFEDGGNLVENELVSEFVYEPKEYEIQDFVCKEQYLVDALNGSGMTKLGKIRVCKAKIDIAEDNMSRANRDEQYEAWYMSSCIWKDCMNDIKRNYKSGGKIGGCGCYKDGGLAYGNSHDKGGMPLTVKSTGQNIEIEGGEGVVNKRSMQSTKKIEFQGKKLTPCEVVSKINEMGGGVRFKCDDVKKIIEEDGSFD